jgi:hypothetical protein
MRASNLVMPASMAICAAVLLTGCGSAGSPLAPSGSLPAQAQKRHHGAHPAMCTPTLWATATTVGKVEGFTAAHTPPCVTLHGPYNGLNLGATYDLAIGSNPNYLYVADITNYRIVVFDYQGNYVKWLDSKLGNTPYRPWGLCVSAQGVVGVGNIRDGTVLQGIVEFFPPNAASGSLPTGYATGSGLRQTFCAFDSAGNFFVVDGTTSNTTHIDYLASSNVDLPAQTLIDSGLGTALWVGMYSRINDPADQTLSAATVANSSATQTVYTWNVSGSGTGPLTFTPCTCSPYVFHHYHHASIPVDQVAPSAGGANGVLYFAGVYERWIQRGPADGGHVTTYAHLPAIGAVGVATNPTGQY